MPNPDYSENFNGRKSSSAGQKMGKGGDRGRLVEKSVGFPGIPGKAGPGFKPGRATKAKVYPSSEGI